MRRVPLRSLVVVASAALIACACGPGPTPLTTEPVPQTGPPPSASATIPAGWRLFSGGDPSVTVALPPTWELVDEYVEGGDMLSFRSAAEGTLGVSVQPGPASTWLSEAGEFGLEFTEITLPGGSGWTETSALIPPYIQTHYVFPHGDGLVLFLFVHERPNAEEGPPSVWPTMAEHFRVRAAQGAASPDASVDAPSTSP